MELKELKCIDYDIDLDEYLKFYKYVRDNMKHPEWLGTFTKEELEYILSHDGRIFNYYDNDILVSSIMYIPITKKTLIKHNINHDVDEVCSLGPVMVNPKYVGNNIQYQMQTMFDSYVKGINKKYIFTKVHPDNIYSIRNVEKSGYKFLEYYESHDGPRNCYLKQEVFND